MTSTKKKPSKTIRIRRPEFEKYNLVLMDWNGERRAKITRRRYDPDEDYWYYSIAGQDDVYYPEKAFGHVVGNKIWFGTMERYFYYRETEPGFPENLKTVD